MFGIGSTELLVILVVALIVLGPKSLAGVSRTLGKAMGEFRRVSTDFQRTLNAEAAEEELKERRMKRDAESAGRAAAPNGAAGTQGTRETSPWERADGAVASKGADENTAPGPASFDEQMTRIGKWEKPDPNGDFSPPPGSPLAEAMEKTRQQARGNAASGDSKAGGVEIQADAKNPDADGKPHA